MKVYVFGSKGMLGKYVTTYLENYYEVIEINRNRFFPVKTLDDYDNIKQNYLLDEGYNLQKK